MWRYVPLYVGIWGYRGDEDVGAAAGDSAAADDMSNTDAAVDAHASAATAAHRALLLVRMRTMVMGRPGVAASATDLWAAAAYRLVPS